ncbi:MAG: hypothetical protein JKY90_01760 [Gammaproteobacteria bacterium]|nr:hypothetical protein [Gammaproteobacteria bacterium]
MTRILVFLITLALPCVLTVNAQSLYSIELQHRSAASLIPLIQPLLNDKEAISGQNSLLLLKINSVLRHQELIKIIEKFDTPAKQLLIEVKSPSTFANNSKQQHTNVIISNRGNSQITHSSRKTISTRSNDPVHRIRVLDGHQASISDGKIIPLLSRSLRFGQNSQNGLLEGVELSYHAVASAIYVRPQLHGNTVTLEITPYYSDIDQETNSGIQSQTSSTTIVVPLNQWSTLSGVSQQSQTQNRNSISTRSANTETQVRVSILPN